MSTIAKAMELLNFFSLDRPEIGLSDFHRLAGRDKATTFRHLTALESVGLLEQNPATRAYRIGPAVLRLAHLREVTLPRRAGVRMVLPRLAEITGETAHASILDATGLTTLAHHENKSHSARVVLHESSLPLHATASGIAVLAYGGAALMDHALDQMQVYTDSTMRSRDEVTAAADTARKIGFSIANQSYEAGVTGIGTPLFDSNGIAGSVAVAAVSSRLTPELQHTIKQELRRAARIISQHWGGSIPPALENAWTTHLGPDNACAPADQTEKAS
ncbi:IclR family transcriptional regulator [Nioella nitratireducens]|uniref:IclR family transcriptional regulator n=1 Tax=Nioella nitratireducens TaxID=1287720 RepID=UPI0008FD0085|nr:IclR family transcriptional regulator [Nioella nitratireducens]